MTEPKSGMRRRRSSGTVVIPRAVLKWFRGEAPDAGWSMRLWPGPVLVYERWAHFAAMNPGATPPTGFEWIAGPPPKTLGDMPHHAGGGAGYRFKSGAPWAEVIKAATESIRHGVTRGVAADTI